MWVCRLATIAHGSQSKCLHEHQHLCSRSRLCICVCPHDRGGEPSMGGKFRDWGKVKVFGKSRVDLGGPIHDFCSFLKA